MSLRLRFRRLLQSAGYDLHRLPYGSMTFRDLEVDLPHLVKMENPVVIDVGANRGQTIDMIRRAFSNAKITAFEPNPDLLPALSRDYREVATVEGVAVGSAVGRISFHVSENPELSSVLAAARSPENIFAATPVRKVVSVPVTTIDSYMQEKNIKHINLLKSDTQGFDLEVLRGASQALDRGAVDTILVETNFISLYEQQSTFGEIEQFLKIKNYRLTAFYEIARPDYFVSWATTCFQRASSSAGVS